MEAIQNTPALPTRQPQNEAQRARVRMAWLIWAVSASFLLFQFMIQLSSGEMVSGLMKSFSLTALGGGFLASTYYYVYVTLQIPAGVLMDRFGPRLLLSLGALVMMVGSFIFGVSHMTWLAIVGRMMMGGGAAFAFVGSMTLIARWFPAERFGMLVAIAESIGMFGSILGGVFMADVVQHMGWRVCMMGAGVIALISAVVLWKVVRDRPPEATSEDEEVHKSHLIDDVKKLVGKKVTWVNGLYSGLIFTVVTVFVGLWGIPFMRIAHHLTLIQAALVTNLVFIGITIGGPIIGWVDARTNARPMVMAICSLATLIILSVVIYFPGLPIMVIAGLMTLLGISCSSYILTFVIANEISTKRTQSTSLGFVNTLSVGTAPILQPLVGLVIMLLAGHSIAHSHFTLEHYQIGLSVILLAVLASIFLAMKLPYRKAIS